MHDAADASEMISAAADELLSRAWDRGDLRKASGLVAAAPFWRIAADAGWFSLLEPGSDAEVGFADALGIFRAAGATLLPGPLFAAVVAGPSLAFGDGSVAYAGERWVTGGRPTLELSGGERLTGEAVLPEGDPSVSRLVLRVANGSGVALAVVAADQDGVVLQPLPTPDAVWSPCRVSLRDAAVELVTNGFLLERLPTWQGCAWAYRCVGVLEATLRLATDYAKTREQFGTPIGRFQAVQHLLAEAAVQVATAASVCQRLDHLLRTDDPRLASAVLTAHGYLARCLRDVSEKALQVLAGVGFTVDSDLHLYMKHALQLASAYGTEDEVAARVGRAVLGAEA